MPQTPQTNSAPSSIDPALILLASQNGTGSPHLQPQTQVHRFLDPKDLDRRFVLINLDKTPRIAALSAITSIEWETPLSDDFYERIFKLVKPPARSTSGLTRHRLRAVLRGHAYAVTSVSLSADGRRAVSGSEDGTMRMWDVEGLYCPATLEGHTDPVFGVSLSADGRRAVSGSEDGRVRVWDVVGYSRLTLINEHVGKICVVSLSADGRLAVLGSSNGIVQVWHVAPPFRPATIGGHMAWVCGVSISANGRRAVSGSSDGTMCVWDVDRLSVLATLASHIGRVLGVSLSADGRRAVSGSDDSTVRVWDVDGRSCLASLEGHTDTVRGVSLSADGRRAVSGSDDSTVRVWDVDGRSCLASLEGHTDTVRGVSLSADGRRAVSGSDDGTICVWDLSDLTASEAPATASYTCAKVLLTGDSGVGKSGLAHWMVHEKLIPTISTDAVWATILPFPQTETLAEGTEREVWLWDFAGQHDYRLIHQLYMEGTDVALLVFNPQDDDPYEGLAEWDRAISLAAAGRPFVKLLVAGRVDRGGLRVSGEAMKAFAKHRGFRGYHETSAETGQGCAELRREILGAIPWDRLPSTASPRTFRRIKEEVIKLKDEGDRVLLRIGELESELRSRISDEPFTPEELVTVVRLLAGAGVIWLFPYEERRTRVEVDLARGPSRLDQRSTGSCSSPSGSTPTPRRSSARSRSIRRRSAALPKTP